MAGDVTSLRRTASGPGVVDRHDVAARTLSWVSLGAVFVTFLMFVALHLLPPTSAISAVHRTISEYALTSSAWAFDLGVISLCVSSVAVFAALVVLRRIAARSAGTIFGGLWVAGLLTLVSFPKHNWALGGAGSSGQIHRIAALVAFLAFPMAVIAVAGRRGRTGRPVAGRWAFWLATLSFAWFSPIVVAVVMAPRAWWQEIPLGLVERGLALTEVSAVVALALLARAMSRRADSGPAGTSGVQSRGQLPDLDRTDATATADQ